MSLPPLQYPFLGSILLFLSHKLLDYTGQNNEGMVAFCLLLAVFSLYRRIMTMGI